MELRELAERVLFSTSLEEKLACPQIITDEQPGAAIQAPAMPGRPKELIFKPAGTARGEFPGTRHLEKPGERGRLLHFFGNHELLATELMALVLLRFPDAPPAFRRGVLATLKDEQEHTRLYMKRMQACGIQFGELPVSGYFWRSVAGMEDPMDYVAGLCLTFEQANLDFARHYGRCFGEVGDADSAKLLEKIYRDEIGHVAYGLKWFRRWKNPNESDWDAFCRVLKFPLSPSRAKGFAINVEGRLAAGLEVSFIEHLNVFSQSKGRTPSVFVFNPLAEARIAGGKRFSPNKLQSQLVNDLANLPQFLCRQDDIVVVPRRPAVPFLNGLKKAGFMMPEFVEDISVLGDRKLGGLRPWAWGPDSVELFTPLFPNVTTNPRQDQDYFNEQIAPLYSKAWSANFLKSILASHEGEDWICSSAEVGLVTDSLCATLEKVAAIRSLGHHKIILKQAIGVAGGGTMRLFEPEVMETQKRWIQNVIDAGQQLIVEPWLERELDFSVQLEMLPKGLKPRGYTGLINNANGQFWGNWAEPKFERLFPVAVLKWFARNQQIQRLYLEIFTKLEAEFRRLGFLGPVGIDALVYRTANREIRLKPIVEINPRYTMGRLLVELMPHVCAGSFGLLQLVTQATLKAAGQESFSAYTKQLRAASPLQLEGLSGPRIRAGSICLNDPDYAQAGLAVFRVFKDGSDIQRLSQALLPRLQPPDLAAPS